MTELWSLLKRWRSSQFKRDWANSTNLYPLFIICMYIRKFYRNYYYSVDWSSERCFFSCFDYYLIPTSSEIGCSGSTRERPPSPIEIEGQMRLKKRSSKIKKYKNRGKKERNTVYPKTLIYILWPILFNRILLLPCQTHLYAVVQVSNTVVVIKIK